MKITLFSTLKLTSATALCILLSGCATFATDVKKAPCGPIAGMTDPCGNRVPINKQKTIDTAINEEGESLLLVSV